MKYPTEQEIMDVLNKVKAEKLTAYEDKVSDEPLIAEQPKAGTIVKRKKVRSVLPYSLYQTVYVSS